MGGGRGGLPDMNRGGAGSPLQVRYTKSGGAIRFRCITKSGGGGNLRQVHYEKWGGGGNSRQVQKLCKPGPAPHKRTLTLLGGGGGGFVRTPRTPLGYGLGCAHVHLSLINIHEII